MKQKFRTENYADARELIHSVKDKEFVDALANMITAHLTDPEMNVDFICSEMGMSRTKLYQKIKKITGQSIGDLVRTIRLKNAAALMTQEDISLTDVMYRVGIQTQSYFTKAFKKEFGKTPSQFLKDLNK